MNTLFNKRILLGVTGSIAAYKACDLVRQLRQSGCDVRVVMTRSAMEFVSPLTFQALSQHTVHRDLLDEKAESAMSHIELARWADAIVVAPASADFIARLSVGRADDLLCAICLASSAPLAVAPAMNQQMWQNESTQANIQLISNRNIRVIGPGSGDQACGENGPGRMLEPSEIIHEMMSMFVSQALSGLTVIVTAGPTREPIDPVRYISNRSSGKMGFALAQAVVKAGGKCILISGPVQLATPEKCERINVETGAQMLEAVQNQVRNANILISSAAVSDYRPAETATQKIKKQHTDLNLALIRNSDILEWVTEHNPNIFTVGFAAETIDVEQNARDKLARKNLNMIVANNVSDSDIGFDSDDNEVTVFWKEDQRTFYRASKHRIARQLIDLISQQFSRR